MNDNLSIEYIYIFVDPPFSIPKEELGLILGKLTFLFCQLLGYKKCIKKLRFSTLNQPYSWAYGSGGQVAAAPPPSV